MNRVPININVKVAKKDFIYKMKFVNHVMKLAKAVQILANVLCPIVLKCVKLVTQKKNV